MTTGPRRLLKAAAVLMITASSSERPRDLKCRLKKGVRHPIAEKKKKVMAISGSNFRRRGLTVMMEAFGLRCT
uniref:Putative secreted protein n=1 Tax=Ixodes ricinus TaxID=34613 RepID=A0A6B0U175_IXORI